MVRAIMAAGSGICPELMPLDLVPASGRNGTLNTGTPRQMNLNSRPPDAGLRLPQFLPVLKIDNTAGRQVLQTEPVTLRVKAGLAGSAALSQNSFPANKSAPVGHPLQNRSG